MDKLQPCPFCGREDTMSVASNVDLGFACDTEAYGFTVNCSGLHEGCGATCGYYDTEAEAVEHWNTRLMLG